MITREVCERRIAEWKRERDNCHKLAEFATDSAIKSSLNEQSDRADAYVAEYEQKLSECLAVDSVEDAERRVLSAISEVDDSELQEYPLANGLGAVCEAELTRRSLLK
jgi:O6-methylguanine-DNA--protein-cysteine methyltransferase